jgi:hypothetical protein
MARFDDMYAFIIAVTYKAGQTKRHVPWRASLIYMLGSTSEGIATIITVFPLRESHSSSRGLRVFRYEVTCGSSDPAIRGARPVIADAAVKVMCHCGNFFFLLCDFLKRPAEHAMPGVALRRDSVKLRHPTEAAEH